MVYSCIPEGESLKQIKVYTTVKASFSTLLSVLMDVPNYPNWIYNCSESKMIKKKNQKEMTYYSISVAPWPIHDRDLVLKNKVYQEKDTKILYSISTPRLNLVPKKEGMVRIEEMYGKWKFTPLKSGYILIEYNLKIDVGGSVPDWVINLFIDNGPYQTMIKYKECLDLKKYKDAKIDFIIEP